MDYKDLISIDDFGFEYTVRHLGTRGSTDYGYSNCGTMRGKDSILITFIFDQMPTDIIKKAQNKLLYEFSGVDVNFRIPWSKAV